jgi:hypothetical protein
MTKLCKVENTHDKVMKSRKQNKCLICRHEDEEIKKYIVFFYLWKLSTINGAN